jgi:hypothetical protein
MIDEPGFRRIDRLEESDRSEALTTTDPRHHSAVAGRTPNIRKPVAMQWALWTAVWAITIAVGCLALEAYANRPGKARPTPSGWPLDSVIPLDGRRPTLLMFLHPLCPCSRASLDELAELIARCGDRVSVHTVVLHTDSLKKEGLDRVMLTGTKTWQDDGGAIARQFGVLTSGHVLLFEPAGGLLYSGGITPSRGKSGENLGRSLVFASIMGERPLSPIPVFGCPLFDSRMTRAEEPRP